MTFSLYNLSSNAPQPRSSSPSPRRRHPERSPALFSLRAVFARRGGSSRRTSLDRTISVSSTQRGVRGNNYRLNSTVRTMWLAAGLPPACAGSNIQSCTACSAARSSRRGPDTIFVAPKFPFSSITASSFTTVLTSRFFAQGGSGGWEPSTIFAGMFSGARRNRRLRLLVFAPAAAQPHAVPFPLRFRRRMAGRGRRLNDCATDALATTPGPAAGTFATGAAGVCTTTGSGFFGGAAFLTGATAAASGQSLG